MFSTETLVFLFAIQDKNVKIQRNYIFSVVLYDCDTWFRILMEEYMLRYPRTWCWRRYFGLGGRTQLETGENYVTRSVIICIPY